MNKTIPLLLDAGNIIFTVAVFPQLYKTYQNRHSLKDLSIFSFIFITIATVCFFMAGILIRAYFTIILTGFNVFYNLLTVYWIWRCKK